jgi:hypothetical protein
VHLDDEQVARLLHGELGADTERMVREHLVTCQECRSLVAEAEKDEAEIYGLFRALDHAPPRVDASTIAVRAGTHRSVRIRWAAGLLVAAVAGSAAIAAPGLPVRGWLRAALERITPRTNVPQIATPRATSDAAPGLAGIAVAPGQDLQILFTSAQSSGDARVSLTNDAEVIVRTATGAATFTSDAGRLVIDNKGSASAFEILIPRSAPRVEIRVGSARIFLKQNARITAAIPVSPEGVYVLPLKP